MLTLDQTVFTLIRDKPATTFMSADGVNGKQNITKIGANPFPFNPPHCFFVLSHAYLQTKRNDCDQNGG